MALVMNPILFSSRSLVAVVIALLCFSPAFAEPRFGDLKISKDPILVKARAKDLMFVSPDVADQAEAEQLYRQFINEHPDHELVPWIWFEMGQMYTARVLPDWSEKYGHEWNSAKAYECFLNSKNSHPEGLVSSLYLEAWISAASLAPTEAERVDMYVDLYKWIYDIKKEEVESKIWLSQLQENVRLHTPEIAANFAAGFLRDCEMFKETIRTNVISIAKHSRNNPIELLKAIENRAPADDLLARTKEARENLAAENPFYKKPPQSGGRTLGGQLANPRFKFLDQIPEAKRRLLETVRGRFTAAEQIRILQALEKLGVK